MSALSALEPRKSATQVAPRVDPPYNADRGISVSMPTRQQEVLQRKHERPVWHCKNVESSLITVYISTQFQRFLAARQTSQHRSALCLVSAVQKCRSTSRSRASGTQMIAGNPAWYAAVRHHVKSSHRPFEFPTSNSAIYLECDNLYRHHLDMRDPSDVTFLSVFNGPLCLLHAWGSVLIPGHRNRYAQVLPLF
jgi:hypothetical protein